MSDDGIDWSEIIKYEPGECSCRCGKIFYSHAKFVGERQRMIAHEKCPGCGKNDDLRRYSSGPEVMIIGGKTAT